MSVLSILSIRRFLDHTSVSSSCQELKRAKPAAPQAAAFEKHAEVSTETKYEPVEDQLACFQYVGGIFKHGGGF